MAQIEVKNLEKTYVKEGVETPALRGVSFNKKRVSAGYKSNRMGWNPLDGP